MSDQELDKALDLLLIHVPTYPPVIGGPSCGGVFDCCGEAIADGQQETGAFAADPANHRDGCSWIKARDTLRRHGRVA